MLAWSVSMPRKEGGANSYHQAFRAGALGVSKGEDAKAGGMGAPKLHFSHGFSLTCFITQNSLLQKSAETSSDP